MSRGDHRMAAYEQSLHGGGGLVRVAGVAPRRVLLVGGRGAGLIAPLLLAIAAEHDAELVVYARPDWPTALPRLLREHRPDVVLVESDSEPRGIDRALVWVRSPAPGAAVTDYAALAARAWREAGLAGRTT